MTDNPGMFIRKIGKVLRGKATPLQLMMAAVLSSMLGFVPGFAQGPGLIACLIIALLILNANLAVAAIVGLLAKIASLALLPVSFAVGQALLDGPTQSLFVSMINAPVLALFGFEYYATTGGIVVGAVFGVVAGVIVVMIVNAFRRKMAAVEGNAERFNAFAQKKWVKALTFIFIGGGKGKLTYAQLLERRMGNPVRLLGVVAAALLIALIWLAQMFFSEPIVYMVMKNGLEQANGATVDMDRLELDVAQGRLVVHNVAMADPNNLATDVFRASRIEAAINSTDLLRKRARIDRVVVTEGSSGQARKFPGTLIRRPVPTPQEAVDWAIPDKSLEEYLADAQMWKERLAQVRHWLEKLVGSGDADSEETRETVKQRTKRMIAESGYARVKASHLVQKVPTLVIGELSALGVQLAQLPGDPVDVSAGNLSTHPRLLAQAPEISIKSRSKSLNVLVRMNEAAEVTAADGQSAKPKANRLRFTLLGVPTSKISAALAQGPLKMSPVEGGTMDIDLRGGFQASGGTRLNLPLNVTFHDTNVTIPQAGSQAVKELKVALGVRGPIDNPRIHVDQKALADALTAAGAAKLASHVRSEADKAISKATEKATEKVTKQLEGKLGEQIPSKVTEGLGEKVPGQIDKLLPGNLLPSGGGTKK